MSEKLELTSQEEIQQQDAGSINIPEAKPIVDAEWCFQFFDNEPIVFAWSTEGDEATPLVINIDSVEGQGISFTQNGMSFRVFPRPISEESKEKRNLELQNQKDDIR